LSVRSYYRRLYTPEQMRTIDRTAIEELGAPSVELMENAGRGAALVIADIYRELDLAGDVLILCGGGNNGGDGLVAARHLTSVGIPVAVYIVASESRITGDSGTNLQRLRESGIEPVPEPDPIVVPDGTALVVDALLGTGSRGVLREPFAAWARACRDSTVPVVAIDAPSGVDLATGAVEGDVFTSIATAALAELKTGYFQMPARAHVGRVYPIDIGIPDDAHRGISSDTYLITGRGVHDLLPRRPHDGHKGTFGRLAVVGGSTGMTGAAVLASRAALRAGCGLVSLGVPASLNAICETKVTEVVTHPLPELKRRGALAVRAAGEIERMVDAAAACVLGCGVGRHHETQELLGRLIERLDRPLVLDADGIYPFGADPDRLVRHRAPLVITPHAGELAHLLSVTVMDIEGDRVGSALRAARHFDCVCVLKGAGTVVATVTGQAYINPTGNAGMGTAGSGDVLAGLIGSLIVQGMSVIAAATAGVYLHGLAGDVGAAHTGERGLIAGDIAEALPQAFGRIEAGEWPAYY